MGPVGRYRRVETGVYLSILMQAPGNFGKYWRTPSLVSSKFLYENRFSKQVRPPAEVKIWGEQPVTRATGTSEKLELGRFQKEFPERG